MIKVSDLKKDFPIFDREINGKRLTYLDSGATSQKPNSVINVMTNVYTNMNANVHRGTYVLSSETTAKYEEVRNKLKNFINAYSSDEIIFTKGCTEGFNFLANSICKDLNSGDEIILSEIEHHANIIPWQMVAAKYNLKINYVNVSESFELDFDHLVSLLNKNTKVVSIVGESNISGMLPDIKKINSLVKEKTDAVYIVDGAQLVPHRKIDVQDLGIDFLCVSGHKMLGPTGIGVVWGRKELLEDLDPVYGGGDMIEEVFYDTATWAPIPHKFEAGTPPYVEAIGLGAAVDYLSNLDMNSVQKHSDDLREYAKNKLENIDGLNIIHTNSKVAGCTFAMSVDGIHATDVSLMLDTFGVAVRAGHHCVQPFHRKLNLDATFRATGYVYNDEEDFDILSNAIEESIKLLT
ncbi:MAG: SufS family cysteine desulfurase [Actinomycetota bacterium]|jgi:cysteine desulfurase/selenocysteine lyase|nr:SufS family cysteine desulfurase [Actinomycetota bacterium]MDA3008964.1 SufS family cysteine desulfurase [Actinomycetota bacterium]MDA3036969.1 SufS family cysteine desulfurase [Actinomycetota bacterium]